MRGKALIFVVLLFLPIAAAMQPQIDAYTNQTIYGPGDTLQAYAIVGNLTGTSTEVLVDSLIASDASERFKTLLDRQKVTLAPYEQKKVILFEFIVPIDFPFANYTLISIATAEDGAKNQDDGSFKVIGTQKETRITTQICADSECKTRKKVFIEGEKAYAKISTNQRSNSPPKIKASLTTNARGKKTLTTPMTSEQISTTPQVSGTEQITLMKNISANSIASITAQSSGEGYVLEEESSEYTVIQSHALLADESQCNANLICEAVLGEDSATCPQDCPKNAGAGSVCLSQPPTVIPINDCGPITASGNYALQRDLIGLTSTCFVIRASDVVLDGNGHKIAAAGSPLVSRLGIDINAWNAVTYANIVVKNIVIENFGTGVSAQNFSNLDVVGVKVLNSLWGVNFISGRDSSLSDSNIINGSRGGARLMDVNNSFFSDNNYYNCGATDTALMLGNTFNNTFINQTLDNPSSWNENYGISLGKDMTTTSFFAVSGNTFQNTVINNIFRTWLYNGTQSFDNNFTNTTLSTYLGSINFPGKLIVKGHYELNGFSLRISLNKLIYDPSFNPYLTGQAIVKLNNVTGFSSPTAYKDGSMCLAPTCTNFQNLGNNSYSFNITLAGTYSVGENTGGVNFHPADADLNWMITQKEFMDYGNCFIYPQNCLLGLTVNGAYFLNAGTIFKYALNKQYSYVPEKFCPPDLPGNCWTFVSSKS